jgi:tetratricopeptide (TPR) repeat protein
MSDRLTEKDRLYIAAWYATANLDYPSAILPLREVIKKYPTETEAYLRLGYLLRGEEKFDEAISVMRQGLTIDPESAALYNALGLLYSLLGRHDEAIASHLRYVALEPNESNSHDSLGMSYQWAGRYEEAIDEYARARELNPNFEIAYSHLGVAYFQTGRYWQAIEWFKKSIAVAPSKLESSRSYFYIAHIHRKLKNYKEAIIAAKKAFEENKHHVFELYSAALERGDRTTAKKLEEQLFAKLEISNRGSRITQRITFYFRGYITLKNGQTNEALENFREVLRHSPLTWDIDSFEDCLANAYLELGRFDEAIGEYERVLRLNPNYPLARFHLAQAFERKGQMAEAQENYRLFLQIWKDADADIPEITSAKKFVSESL